MENVLGYLSYAVIAPFHFTHLARKSLAERTTNKYLQTVSDTSLLHDLGDALEPLLYDLGHVEQIFYKFAIKNQAQEPVWIEQCFINFIEATYGGAQTIGSSLTLGWQYFCSAAYYPLHAPTTGAHLDLRALKRAFALLPLQGIELLGYEQIRGGWDHTYALKVPRIARFIISCATQSVKSTASQSEIKILELGKDLTVDNISDVISFAQPRTYEHYPDGPCVPIEHFQDATQRVVSLARSQPSYTPVTPEIRKVDLEYVLQTLMLVSLQDRRWRSGLETPVGMGFAAQKSADIQYSRLVPVAQAQELAGSVLAHSFTCHGDAIPCGTFEQYLLDCPAFSLLFFQIWASMFAPTPTRHKTTPKTHSHMPISISNSLSLLNVAKFLGLDQSRARYFQDELQLNVDLQVSSLVLDTHDPPSGSGAAIDTILKTGPHFYVLLVRGQTVEVTISGNGDDNTDQLLVLFIAPQDPKMQIWRQRDNEQSHVQYVWRSSYVQLLPAVVRIDAGPLSVVDGEDLGGDDLLLRAQSGERSDVRPVPSIKFNMASSTMSALNVASGGAAMTLRWTSLQCYRMPGTACPVTYGP